LAQILETEALTPSQQSYALDLLGIPTEVRQAGRTVLDAPAGHDPRTVARAVLQGALAQLQDPAAVATRAQLDQSRQRQARQGTPVKISRERRLMKRYEAMHARRRREAWQEFERLRLGLRTWPEEIQQKLAKIAGELRDQELRAGDAAASAVKPSPKPAPAATAAP